MLKALPSKKTINVFIGTLILSLSICTIVHAQVATYYTWTQSSGTYTPGISTTSSTPANIFSTGWDDVSYNGYALPFSFTFNGTAYSNIGIDADAWITFSNGTPTMTGNSAAGSWVSISDHTGVYLTGSANNNGFAGFNCDINDQSFNNITGTRTSGSTTITGVSSTTNLQIGTRLSGNGIPAGTVVNAIAGTTITMSAAATANSSANITPSASIYAFSRGTAPNRQFVIQWTQAKRYVGSGTENINFQLILNEGNGNAALQTLQVVYGTCTTTDAANLDVQVGLRGASATDFNARKSTSAWTATVAATANTNTVRFSNTTAPASGLTFTWSPCTSAPPAAGVLSGPTPVCAGSNGTYTLAAVAGATSYTWAYSGSGATFPVTTTGPSNTIIFSASATSGLLTATPKNICGSGSASPSFSITVTPVPVASISYASPGYCINTAGSIAVNQTGSGGGTYSVSPAGLSINSSSGSITPSLSSAGVYTVTYSFASGSCTNTTTTTVKLNSVPSVSATASPAVMCAGGTSQLLATVSNEGYTVAPISYSSIAPSGSPVNVYNTYTDEAISGAILLPFTFNFYGTAATQFYVCSNGYVQLQSGPVNSLTPQTLPNASTPNNVIALAWDDLVVDPSTLPGANIRYFVNGSTPNRIFVIEFTKLSFYGTFSNSGNVTGQIRLFESDNHIEIAAATINDNGQLDSKTLGIENGTGTSGITPSGRNNVVWNLTTPEAWAFYPSAYNYLWTPATFLNNATIANPLASGISTTTNYNVLVANTGTGCSGSANVPVTIAAPLNGTYTVGAGGNYSTLTAAVNAYNTLCVSGPVTFSLIDNLYSTAETFPIIINSTSSASAVNTLTIKPATGRVPLITGSSANSIIQFNGADYVTIDGSNTSGGTTRDLSLTNTKTTSNSVIWISSAGTTNGATNNRIKNCKVYGFSSTGTIACILTGSGAVPGNGAQFPNSNNTIANNLLYKAQNGAYIAGKPADLTALDQNWSVTGNNIGSALVSEKLGFRAMSIQNAQAFNITKNVIAGVYSGPIFTTTSNMSGIAVYGNINSGIISENKVSDIRHADFYGATGIYLGAKTTASDVSVVNNMVFDVAAYGDNGFTTSDNGYGIAVDSGGGYKIYYNTVVLNTNQTSTAGNMRSAAFLVGSGVITAASIRLQNNIFGNLQTNCGNANGSYAFVSAAANSVYALNNYNMYYRPQLTNGSVACKATNTNYNTLPTIQAAVGLNANSLVYSAAPLPLYVSATDYHLQSVAANSIFSNLASPITGITIDYDSTTRNGLTPDIGADEWLMPNTGSWVGKTSIDWLVPSNWETNTIPTATTDVAITGGYVFMPTVVTMQPVRNLLLSAPVPANTPLLTLNNGTLQIYGNIVRTAGTIEGSNGTVEMNGTASQTIPAGLFTSNNLKNLVVGNNAAAGVIIGGTLDIYRSLTFSPSGLKLTTGNFLTFKSTATETAWLGNVNSKIIVGNATVERYIPTGLNHGKSWQLLAVPVSGTQSVKAAWQEGQNSTVPGPSGYGTTISSEKPGATGRGFDFFTAPGPSIKTYNPLTNAFVGIDNGITNTSAIPIENKKGYMILVRGDRSVQTSSAPANATTLRTYGRLFTASAAELPPSTTVLPNKFETIGNPYASAIDFQNITRASGVDNVFYVWDPLLPGSNGLGGYQTISSVTGYLPTPGSVNYPSNISYTKIQSGQAFYVHGTAGGSVSFTENAKLTGSRLVMRSGPVEERKLLGVSLLKMSSLAAGPVDGNVIAFDHGFSNDFESMDALKLPNTGENFSILSNGNLLAVEARKPLVITDTIFYNIAGLRHEAYQFSFGPVNIKSPVLKAFLVDRFLNTQTPVSLSDSTSVDFTITNDIASAAAGRFYLIFRQIGETPVAAKSSKIAQAEILKTKAPGLTSSISVYPNPVVNKTVFISFVNQVAGYYQLTLSNKLGQIIYTEKVYSYGNEQSKVALGGTVAPGAYQLSIMDINGKETIQQIIIK